MVFIRVAGGTVASGGDKSYIVKKQGEKVAFKVEKKKYDQEFKIFFGDCKEFMKKHGKGQGGLILKHRFSNIRRCASNLF